MTAQLGVGLAKRKFDAALLNDGKIWNKVFENTLSGFRQLVEWLAKQGVQDVHVCMEATSDYGEALATFLHDAGYVVIIVNPAQIKGFAQSKLLRTKTDNADACLIAQFCQVKQIKLIRQAIRDHIDQHPDLRDKRELLDSIPGIGEAIITQILAYLAHVQFSNAKQVAAFHGLNPKRHLSGSSVRGKARISKTGNARLR